MTRNTFNTWTLRSALRVSVFISLAIFVAVSVAEPRGQSSTEAQDESASIAESGVIDAVVSEVNGTQLKITGGIVIDVSQAIVLSMAGERLGVSITPGMCIRASIISSDAKASTLVADTVRLRLENEVVISGPLQAVDFESGFITVLSQRIVVNAGTSLPVGFKQKKLRVGLPVSVIARPNGNDLVGTLILPNVPLPRIFP